MVTTKTHELVCVALMAAVLCVLAPMAVPIGPVPISLATFVVYLMAYVLGARLGALSALLYLCIGLAGVPVFSGYSAGLAKLAGPTGGYLVTYTVLAYISGVFIENFPKNRALQIAGMVLGTAILYTIGTVWLAMALHLSADAALSAGVIPFLPGDAAKIVISAIVGPVLRERLEAAHLLP